MGSKINTTYWGANVDPYVEGSNTYSYGLSSNTIRDLIANGAYCLNTDSFDYSVSPWGIGYSAAGNRGQIAIQRQGAVDGSAPGIITKISFEGIDRENTNRPFYIPNSGAGGLRDNYNWIMARVGGDCSVNDSNYIIDNYNNQILAANSNSSDCISNQYACTFFNYQHFKLAITAFNYINLDTGIISQYSFVQNNSPSDVKTNFENYTFPEHMAITTIYVQPRGYAMRSGSPTQWVTNPVPAYYGLMQMRGHAIGDAYLFNKIGLNAMADDKYKLFAGWNLGAYGVRDSYNPYYTLPRNYYSSSPYVRNIPVKDVDYRSAPNGINYSLIQVDGLGTGANSNYDVTLVSNYCDKVQNFADISYKQRPLLYTVTNNALTEIKEGYALQSGQGQFRATSIYEVSDSDTFTKSQILALIKHEVAFYGFEFFIQWGDSTGGTWTVGDDDLFLPVFDEHLITTGNYLSGTAALSAPNASWGNVFDDTMPVYDYEYNPEPNPSPSIPDEDSGYLNQRTYHGYHMQGSNKYYALNETELIQLIAEINGLYADTSSTPDPSILDTLQKQVAVNFKGSNPADYIVGIYGYPFGIPHVATSSPVMIGPVGTSISASIVESQAVGAMTFGSISIPYDGNFLDYAPYTQMQLYLPMLGTVDLDPAFYTGHEVSVEYIYDINTGSLSGVVYRDDIIDKIIDGSLCAQVPVTARNMGDYQNNLHQMKMALVNSALTGMQNSFGLFTEGAKTVQGSMNGDSPLAGMTMSSVDIFAVPFNAGQGISNAVYAIEHSMPKLASTSTASSNNAMQFDFTPVLFIKRASMLPEYDSALYGHTVGFGCCLNKTLGDMSGLTVATNIDTSNITTANGQALTADEINAIKQAFNNGVYV